VKVVYSLVTWQLHEQASACIV